MYEKSVIQRLRESRKLKENSQSYYDLIDIADTIDSVDDPVAEIMFNTFKDIFGESSYSIPIEDNLRNMTEEQREALLYTLTAIGHGVNYDESKKITTPQRRLSENLSALPSVLDSRRPDGSVNVAELYSSIQNYISTYLDPLYDNVFGGSYTIGLASAVEDVLDELRLADDIHERYAGRQLPTTYSGPSLFVLSEMIVQDFKYLITDLADSFTKLEDYRVSIPDSDLLPHELEELEEEFYSEFSPRIRRVLSSFDATISFLRAIEDAAPVSESKRSRKSRSLREATSETVYYIKTPLIGSTINDYNHQEDSLGEYDLYSYLDDIKGALSRDRTDLARYISDDSWVKDYVISIIPGVGVDKKDRVFGWTKVVCSEPLPGWNYFDQLAEYITGQFSDGWGESFEQSPIVTIRGEVGDIDDGSDDIYDDEDYYYDPSMPYEEEVFLHYWNSNHFYVKVYEGGKEVYPRGLTSDPAMEEEYDESKKV